MRPRDHQLISLYHPLVLIFGLSIFTLLSCETEIIEQTPEKISADRFEQVIDLEGDLEVSDFVWRSLNQYYYWQNDVAELSDTFLESEESYKEFIFKNNDPDVFFESLIHPDDPFSFIQENYLDLENLIQGIEATNGVEFGLLFACQNCRQLIGYVKYIVDGSNASEKDIQRGDLFSGVDGVQLTIENYRELLFGDNFSYTLNMVSVSNGTIVSNGKEVALTKQENFEINPIHVKKILGTANGKVGYLMYNQFVADKSTELNEVFGNFKEAGISDLIIDLRYNGGGSVNNCVALASMITGQFPSEIFVQEQWNSKMSNFLSREYGKESLINRFVTTLTDGEKINSLSLDRVYILTSSESASASELLINGLKSFIEVVHIGETTVGKNVGSITVYDYIDAQQTKNPDHTYALQPIVLKIANKDGFSDYSQGLDPDYVVKEEITDFGVLGDPNEALLSYAVSLITGDDVASSKKEFTFPLNKVRDPLMIKRQRMFVDKKINLRQFRR
jgi:C-terminal processing protease CtpA/Prc